MTNACFERIREGLLSVGHRERFMSNIAGPGLVSVKQGFVAYADRPFDARTSTFVAVDMGEFDVSALSLLQTTGAPIIAQCASTHALLWKQSAGKATFIERVETQNVLSFFQKHREELAPGAIYRAKLWGRTNPSLQLDMFVDRGLLPLVEQTAGEHLRNLLESAVKDTKSALGWKQAIKEDDGAWLLKAVFWLLAAKILKDKGVRGFVNLALPDVEQVYSTLAKHYNRKDPRPVVIANKKRREALVEAALKFQQAASMGAVTTESLAWVYESALIDKLTRQQLGTHSTPTWLVDDIVAKMRPWIEDMPVDERRVFEPACGHAGFLISAMRLLSELLPDDRVKERKAYLRQRLHGIEIDPFAHEIARLSLTLADVPNGNGWLLENADMFENDVLRSAVSKSTIVLANPPFEKFGDDRPAGAEYFNRADETFRHIVEALPHGGVFGVVLPQSFLRNLQTSPLRRTLLDEYDLSEVTLFADKVFNYGESETAVLLGRRVGSGAKSGTIRYRRVREAHIETYTKTLEASSTETVQRGDLESESASLFVPELDDVWRWLRNAHVDHFDAFVQGGQGFQHRGENDPLLPAGTIRESDFEVEGLVKGFAGWTENQLTHELPKTTWLNMDARTIGRPRHGTVVGKKQILMNYAPVSRAPWRLKALVDPKGFPATSDFNILRATQRNISSHVLWAILNSPVANAYAYAHSSKRHVLVGDLRQLPVFALDKGPFDAVEAAVTAYFKAAKGAPPLRKKSAAKSPKRDRQLLFDVIEDEEDTLSKRQEELKYLHWRIDAEVLRLYHLPAWAERKILDLFTGVRRRGVPFIQDDYFPRGFTNLERLDDLIAITADWTATNERRCQLIRKDVKKQLQSGEPEELQRLEFLADARSSLIDTLYPEQSDALDAVVERLKREGKWVE